jgi:hypothetical protein
MDGTAKKARMAIVALPAQASNLLVIRHPPTPAIFRVCASRDLTGICIPPRPASADHTTEWRATKRYRKLSRVIHWN